MILSKEQQSKLASTIQEAFPLEKNPYQKLAQTIGAPAKVLFEQVGLWRDEGKLREISAVLEGDALGYDSALVTACIPVDQIEKVVSIINDHPTVTHNYLRQHDYNLWFTISVPQEMGLKKTLELLAVLTGVPQFYALKRTHVFKIGVNFDLESMVNTTKVQKTVPLKSITPSPEEKLLFRALQTPLPHHQNPFDLLSDSFEVACDELLTFAQKHLGQSLRRYVGTFKHRKMGISSNAMVVWDVPENQVTTVGPQMAAFSEVSHCYSRNPIPGFPFCLYTMIHGPDRDTCLAIAENIAQTTGIQNYLPLFSTQEFKKTRLRYFLPELDTWWQTHLHPDL